MANFSWPRAKAQVRATKERAYDRQLSNPMREKLHKSHIERINWHNAYAIERRLQMQILNNRIEAGCQWLDSIRPGDPRYPKWSAKLIQLMREREMLRNRGGRS